MKKRILAMLLSIVMLATTVELTSLLTGTEIFTGGSGGVSTSEKADTAATGGEAGESAARLSATTEAAEKTAGEAQGDAKSSGALDADNALTVPYDVAFPEAFAQEDCLYANDQIMVKFAAGFDGKVTAGLKKAGIVSLERLMESESGVWYIAAVSGDVQEVMTKVRALDNVVVAEYDYMYTTASIIDSDTVAEAVQGNTSWRDQWYLRSGNLQLGWDYLRTKGIAAGGDSSVVVAVIDTGVDYTHEDLKDNIWVNTGEVDGNGADDDGDGYADDVYGVDLVAGRGSGMDDHGHGTHVAGIIAAANNNTGIVGLAYNVKIMPIKAGMASGYFNQSAIAKGILYAYEHGADVINMSFGGSASTIAVQEALETAYTRCVLVASAGNDGAPNNLAPSYPAALSYVMGVMSVDEFGVESGFTNYDATAFNSVEYEVYAPGSQILSTIPGNRYATWSGTSMAAPYVSAMAALLRSAYPDGDTYNTKFIYGQIAATGGRNAVCCDPELHGGHNLPKIVDVYKALTELPRPEVSAADFLTLDDEGLNGNQKNNGDGVLDAGETAALAFTLRNRWGMSRDTVVTLDALSPAGIPDPYITFVRNGVNYGSIGTYSGKDFGVTREGDFITGADGSTALLVKIADDCPNDYIIRVNVTVTCRNGLDETDNAVYTQESSVVLTVRRGTLLPRVISEDMTLTKDTYYILPNATVIQAGATVTVEAGTQIQFWSDDPNDEYADTAIAYLEVKGTLVCQGTEEEHVKLFPSELMDKYRVQLYESGSESMRGSIKLYYTDVVNPFLSSGGVYYPGITYAYGCEFSQNYRTLPLYYRDLSGGVVYDRDSDGIISNALLENCVFYRLGSTNIASSCKGCIFVDSAVKLSGNVDYEYTDCVFYGNNNFLGKDGNSVSRYITEGIYWQFTIDQILTDPATGISYAVIVPHDYIASYLLDSDLFQRFLSYLGGNLCRMETDEEQSFLRENLKNKGISPYGDLYLYLCGLREDADGTLRWQDGTYADVSIRTADTYSRDLSSYYWYGSYYDQFYANSSIYCTNYILIEFPAESAASANEMMTTVPTEDVTPAEAVVPTEDGMPAEDGAPAAEAAVSEETAPAEDVPAEDAVPTEAHTPDEDGTPAPEAAPAEDGTTEAESVSDGAAAPAMAAASGWTQERLQAMLDAFCDEGYDTLFYGNAILNRFTDDNVEKWLRIQAPKASDYVRYGIGGNYWGTEGLSDRAKAVAINKQIVDYDDYMQYADLNEGTILETIPATVWPVVRKVELLDGAGLPLEKVGNEKVTFRVTFNRAMDTEMPLQVRFGSSYPYGDYEIGGAWVSDTVWEGTTTLATFIANGTQYMSIDNGRSAEGHLKLYKDWGRFSFEIDTSSAQAMVMQGSATDEGIVLTWMQDDFDTLAGYNVYRSDAENGQFAKLNSSVIPAESKTFTDTNVTPGQMYYYNFTVVKTDLSESDTSGKVAVRAKDNMAPSIYHNGVYSAFTGSKLVISATVKDNVQIDKVELFYRVSGTDEWRSAEMTASQGNKFSAVIGANYITTAGLEYYIRAFDGVNYAYKGSAAQPFAVAVSEAVDSRALGDVNGDGRINVLDALMVLKAINNRLNLDTEQFARADLNGNGQLEAVEVLMILQYANGIIGSVKL